MIKKNNNKPRSGTRSKCELLNKPSDCSVCNFSALTVFIHTDRQCKLTWPMYKSKHIKIIKKIKQKTKTSLNQPGVPEGKTRKRKQEFSLLRDF